MRNGRYYLAALSLAGVTLCGAPAVAGPITPVTVSNVQVDWNQGEGTTTSAEGIYYAGPIIFTIAGKQLVVWCDDLNNVVYIGSSNQYYETDAAGANAYLSNPALSSAAQTTLDHQIAGLAYEGTILANANGLSPASGAELQTAIWELEETGLTDTDSVFQSGVEGFIGQASADYDAMLSAGYTYGELKSPGCNQAPGTITYTNSCQTQGQIFVRPVPEPVTLSFVSVGLVGVAAMRRRRKADKAA